MVRPSFRGTVTPSPGQARDSALLIAGIESRLIEMGASTVERQAGCVVFRIRYWDYFLRWRGMMQIDGGRICAVSPGEVSYEFSWRRFFWPPVVAMSIFTAWAFVDTRSFRMLGFLVVGWTAIMVSSFVFWRWRAAVFARRVVSEGGVPA